MKNCNSSICELSLKRNKTDFKKIQITSSNDVFKYAKQFYDEWVLELPDEKHLDKSGIGEASIELLNNRPMFSHKNEPAVGKWHAVATNGFLNLEVPEVKLLKSILVNDYKKVLRENPFGVLKNLNLN